MNAVAIKLGVGAATFAGLLLGPLSRAWALAPDLGHGWAAPLLAGYLWWERWSQRPALASVRAPWPGAWLILMVALVLALPLRLLLTPYPLWPVALILYLAVVVGLALGAARLLAGPAGVRWLGGPLWVLPAVVPWPGGIERLVILPLREGIASLVAEIMNLAGHPALAAGTSVQLAGGWVGIEEACGGIRSLQAAVMTALFFGEWLRLAWSRRAWLVLLGGVAAVAGNFGRVLFLSWCATEPGALAKWHDAAGWAALGFSLGVTGLAGWLWRPAQSLKAEAVASTPAFSKLAALPPGLARWMMTAAFALLVIEAGTRLWFWRGEMERRAAVPQWTVRLPEDNPTFRRQPLTAEAAEMLRPDDFVSGSWIGAGRLKCSANYIVWRTGQVARSAPFLHNPTICLPYSGCDLVRELVGITVAWPQGVVPFRCFVFRRMNEELVVAFAIWDPARGQPLAKAEGGWDSWWLTQWRDVWEARPNQPAQLLAVAIVGPANERRLPEVLQSLIQAAD
ncbi:MAG: exosortase/archaeosortase family protein [Opitutales bacterium]